jgi:uncharacterized alkaline shock family protein YloU
MIPEDSRTDLGVIKIHKKVIASIAQMASMEIEGVKRIAYGMHWNSDVWGLLCGKQHSAIKVEIDKNDEIKIDVPLVVSYGFNLPEIANKVQENIHRAVEKSTNLSIKDINISIQGVEK